MMGDLAGWRICLQGFLVKKGWVIITQFFGVLETQVADAIMQSCNHADAEQN